MRIERNMFAKTFAISACLVGASIPFLIEDRANAAVMVFTDQTLWENALTGGVFQTENFDGAASNFLPNSSGNVVGTFLTVDVIGHDGDISRQGLTGTGFFEGEVDSSSITTSDGAELVFNFGTPIKGFGLLGLQNDSVTSPGGLDLEEIGIEVNGESFLVSDILGLTNSSNGNSVSTVENTASIPFLGFVSDTEITSFKLLHGDEVAPGGVSGGNEEFFVDGLVVATASTPEPTTLLSLLVVGGLGLSLKRKKQA